MVETSTLDRTRNLTSDLISENPTENDDNNNNITSAINSNKWWQRICARITNSGNNNNANNRCSWREGTSGNVADRDLGIPTTLKSEKEKVR